MARPRRRCARPAARQRRRAAARRKRRGRHARRALPAAGRHGPEDRRARHRHLHAAVFRAAARHLCRLRRRQVDAARDARRRRRLRYRRGGAGRRTRPRGARIPRRHDRPQEHGKDRGCRLDQQRERDDAQARAGHGDADRRAFPRPGRPRASGARFDHPLRACAARGRDRFGRASGGARLSGVRVHRSAQAARTRRTGRCRQGFDHRGDLGADRRRRPQRPGRRFRARHPRRPHRARSRHRRTGPLSAGQPAVVDLAACPEGLERRRTRAGAHA